MINRVLYRLLIFFSLLSAVSYSYVWYSNKTYTPDQISKMFEPITSKYGIRIVYDVDDNFFSSFVNPGMPVGPSRDSKIKPIRHRVLARYPALLKKAFGMYPVQVIKSYLNAIYFAEKIDENGFKFAGSFDPFRRIVYIVDDGQQTDDDAISTFHHEFSSLLLSRHSFLINLWTELNPNDFVYLTKRFDSHDEVKKTRERITNFYEKGFISNYGLTSFENDFNEYAAMIFTNPQKFKKIMNQYPRVRGKFRVFLEFYHEIDPIFTEAYLLGDK